MYFTHRIVCGNCGYFDQGPHIRIFADSNTPPEERVEKAEILRLIPCQGQEKDGKPCRRLLQPRLVAIPYAPCPQLHKGQRCRVLAPGTLEFPVDPDYPLKTLHVRKIEVIVTENIPDYQGLIDVRLLTPVRVKGKMTTEMAVRPGILIPVIKEA